MTRKSQILYHFKTKTSTYKNLKNRVVSNLKKCHHFKKAKVHNLLKRNKILLEK